jgi:hypothetical protein
MATREDLQDWVIQALNSFSGSGTIVQVARHIWENHSEDLQSSGDLFYTWQYDMRWAATKLRDKNIILPAEVSQKGQWRLKQD